MGLYFKGRAILEETMLKKLLGKKHFKEEEYSVDLLDRENRLWIWTNLETDRTIITGDEGNGWCIPLIDSPTRKGDLERWRKEEPKARFSSLIKAIKSLMKEE